MKPGKVVLVGAARSTINYHVPPGAEMENSFLSLLTSAIHLQSFHHHPSWQTDHPPDACFHVVNVLLSSFLKHHVELLVQIATRVDLCSVRAAGTVEGLTCREHLVAQVN